MKEKIVKFIYKLFLPLFQRYVYKDNYKQVYSEEKYNIQLVKYNFHIGYNHDAMIDPEHYTKVQFDRAKYELAKEFFKTLEHQYYDDPYNGKKVTIWGYVAKKKL